jgi:hypothetical protein
MCMHRNKMKLKRLFFPIAQCFSSGAEIGPHKNNHAYQIMVSYYLFSLLFKLENDVTQCLCFAGCLHVLLVFVRMSQTCRLKF